MGLDLKLYNRGEKATKIRKHNREEGYRATTRCTQSFPFNLYLY